MARYGLAGADAIRARVALEDAGLTNPRKRNIATSKLDAAHAALAKTFQRLCRACLPIAVRDHRVLARVDAAYCDRCAGSNNVRAVSDMVAACGRAGVTNVLFVGGSPSFRKEVERLVGDGLELRLVDGTRRITKSMAQRGIAWADVIVVCGATELAHKVSNLYTRDAAARRKLIVTSRRGIEAIAYDVARSDALAGRAMLETGFARISRQTTARRGMTFRSRRCFWIVFAVGRDAFRDLGSSDQEPRARIKDKNQG